MGTRVRISVEEHDDDDDTERQSKKQPHRFKKGDPKIAGRQKGTPNKVTTLMKDAILMAAELEGSDRKGKDGMVGFFRQLSRREPVAYSRLLEKLLPLQITGKDGGPMQLVHGTKEQVVQRMKERGLPVPQSLMATPTHDAPEAKQ